MTLTGHTHLLLDLDGTVLDFQASQREALRWVVTELGVDWSEDHATTYGQINAAVWRAYERGELAAADLRTLRWQRFLEAIAVEADAGQVGTRYLARFATGAHLIDGAVEAVATLAERMTIVAVTNGFGDVQHDRLRRCGLDAHLAGVVVSDQVGAAKPDRRIFDAAFEVAGAPPREHVAILGDSLTSDMAGGRAYGITTIWVDADGIGHDPHPAPDRTVRSITELV